MSHELLKNRPMDKDNEVMEHEVYFAGIPAVMELWVWSGYTGSSIIFCSQDVQNMDEETLVDFVFKELKQPRDPRVQVKYSGEFIFITYGVVESGLTCPA